MTNVNVFQFLEQNPSQEDLELFIMTIFLMAGVFAWKSVEYSSENPKPPLAELEDVNEPVKFGRFWEKVIELVQFCIKEKDEDSIKKIHDFWNLFQDSFEAETAEKQFVVEQKDSQGNICRGLSHLLIVFDEANLVETGNDGSSNLFRNLWKAHQNLNPSSCILVFIDTLSSVSKFQPAQVNDPSHRQVDRKFDLLPPFYEVLTADPDPSPLEESLTGIERLRRIFSYGRPSWYAMFFAPGHDLSKPGRMDYIKLCQGKVIISI